MRALVGCFEVHLGVLPLVFETGKALGFDIGKVLGLASRVGCVLVHVHGHRVGYMWCRGLGLWGPGVARLSAECFAALAEDVEVPKRMR